MSLLLPLGLIGLIGLAVLLLIYLIKPNYQHKQVASTFVWKLSLKYEKRRVPISKLRNLLILLCQILIIALCSLLIASPAIVETAEAGDEVVIVLDASAGMLATDEEETTRFERAVTDARALAAETFANGGRVSVIFADGDADFIVHRASAESRESVDDTLANLIYDEACTYGSADIGGAMNLANNIVSAVEEASVILYTGTEYQNSGSVIVRNMARTDGSEWNVAVLDCRAELNPDNMYVFTVELACYGRDMDVTLNLNVSGVNAENSSLTYRLNRNPLDVTEPIRLTGNKVTTVTVNTQTVVPSDRPSATSVFSFRTVTASVQYSDSLLEDNSFTLYGNTKPTMNIQYASRNPNSFFSAAFLSLQSALQSRWTVNVREVRGEDALQLTQLTGYDLYVFEDFVPSTLPTDGVVFFVNPPYAPAGTGFAVSGSQNTAQGTTLANGEEHPIMNNVYAQNFEVTRYRQILSDSDSGYTPLIYCNGSPVLAAKNEEFSKIVVMSFSLNYSTAALSYDFPRLVRNIVNYYIPSTFSGAVYNVNDEVALTPRGTRLSVVGGGIDEVFTEFPATITVTRVGTYTLTQTPISGVVTTENFFVRIPKEDSNICRVVDVLENELSPRRRQLQIEDLCVYFAGALMLLLIAEQLLRSRSIG